MSVRASQQSTPTGSERYRNDAGLGWVSFAGVVLLGLSTINIIEGIAAIDNANFFTRNANYVIGSLHTWGWVVLCAGIAQLAVALGVLVKNQFARWAGVGILGLNAVVQLLMMPAYPFWSLCLFALAILAMYGLVAHGKRIAGGW